MNAEATGFLYSLILWQPDMYVGTLVRQHTKPIVHFLIKAPKLVHM